MPSWEKSPAIPLNRPDTRYNHELRIIAGADPGIRGLGAQSADLGAVHVADRHYQSSRGHRVDAKNEVLLEAKASEDPAVRASVRGQRVTGPTTKQRIRATPRSALSDAVVEGLITENVAKLVKLETTKRPKGLVWTKERVAAWTVPNERALKKATEEATGRRVDAFEVWASAPRPSKVMVWTPAQLGAFLGAVMSHRLYARFRLIVFAGLRRGESCGCRWTDLRVDHARGGTRGG